MLNYGASRSSLFRHEGCRFTELFRMSPNFTGNKEYIYNIVKTSSLLVKLVMKIWAAHRERDTLYFRVNKRIVILVSYTKVFHLDRFYHHFNFVKRIYEHEVWHIVISWSKVS